jgi:uncharacterized membrane protein YdfJ with MMPL/SSD domain
MMQVILSIRYFYTNLVKKIKKEDLVMAETIEKLRSLTDEEIIALHDSAARNPAVGTSHYLQELYRRDLNRQTKAMLSYTWYMLWITVVIMIANIVLFALSIK